MRDGTVLVEHALRFEDFTALVLGFRRDSECRQVSWHQTGPLALLDLLAAETAGCLAEAQAAVWRADAALVLSGEVA
jgi:hypothetical protein